MARLRPTTIDDILRFAVDREIAAAARYERLIEMARTPGLRELLLALKAEEESHRRLLEGLSAEDVAAVSPTRVPDLQIIDGLADEAPDGDMSLQELLIFAARKEKEAAELYEGLARAASEDTPRRLFEFLASQERSHKLKIEDEYERLVLQEN